MYFATSVRFSVEDGNALRERRKCRFCFVDHDLAQAFDFA